MQFYLFLKILSYINETNFYSVSKKLNYNLNEKKKLDKKLSE